MTAHYYRVDGGPLEMVNLPPDATLGDVVTAASVQRAGRRVELAGTGSVGTDPPPGWESVLRDDEQQPHPDEALGEPLALNPSHDRFVEQYLRQNPHLAAQSGPRAAFGGQISERVQGELDRASRARGPARSGPGFDAHGQRAPHGQQPLHPPENYQAQRPGESDWDWRQRVALEEGPYTAVARRDATKYMRHFGIR